MSSPDAAHRAAVPPSNARAEASRRNGAKSRGPKTSQGKARSARNALKHGMRAQKYVVLPEEDGAEFKALEAALLEELAPASALQTVLARRVAVAAWRLMRADRMEVEVLDFRRGTPDNIGLALIRDGNGTRAVGTLLRYRAAATAELMRSLRTLKALQADARASAATGVEAPARPRAVTPPPAAVPLDRRALAKERPNEPENRESAARPSRPRDCANPGGAPRGSGSGRISSVPRPLPAAGEVTFRTQPIEPDSWHPDAATTPAGSSAPQPARPWPGAGAPGD